MSDAVVREWSRLLGSPVFDITSSVSVAADGSIYVAGSSMVEPGNLAGSNSSYLTKFNSDGSGGSGNLLGSDFNGVPYSVKTAADGSIYIAGIGISYQEDQPNGDIFVGKYNADGSPQWMDSLGSDNDEYIDSPESVALGTDGSIYIAGYTYGDLDGHANRGSSDAFIAKYRSDGSKEWTQFIGSSSEERATGVSAAADGSVYLVGSTRESLDGQTNRGEDDIFISKYSSDGSKEWTRLLGSMTSDLAWSVSTSADGSIYIAGFTYGDLDGQVNAGGSDVFIAKYSSDGAKEWVKQFGSSADDYANSVTTRLMVQFISQALLLVISTGKSIVVRVMLLSQNTVAMVPKYGPNCLGHHLTTSASQSPLVPMVRSTWLVGVLEILTGKPIAVITMDLSRSTGSLIPLTTY